MKKTITLLLTLYIAMLCIPYNAAAQANPAPAGDTFRQEGIASWYGTEFNGRQTESGEIYNSALFTAAHPTLPFGTMLIVTNRHNNRQVTVKVNDRGPFVAGRIIDISRAAAEQLDMLTTGTAPVLIQIVQAAGQPTIQAIPQPSAEPQVQIYNRVVTPPPQQPVQTPQPAQQQPQVIVAPPSPEAGQQGPFAPVTVTVYPPAAQGAPSTYTPIPAAPPEAAPAQETLPPSMPGARLIPAITPSPAKTYRLQVGSFRVASNAVDVYVKLRAAGLNPEYEPNGEFFRVVIKGVRGSDVQSVAVKLQANGFNEALIREE